MISISHHKSTTEVTKITEYNTVKVIFFAPVFISPLLIHLRELVIITGTLVINISRGAKNRKDMDISHPQSPAVSRGEAEPKDRGDDPTWSVRRIRPTCWASLIDQSVKNMPAMQETWV